MRIRAAAEADLPVMREIERAAGIVFAEIGMREIADDEPLSLTELAARQGIGRRLLDHAAAYATATGASALTLTTFAEVPWNAPYYARCGFRIVPDSDLSPGLNDIRSREIAHGLYRWPRVTMRRSLNPASSEGPV